MSNITEESPPSMKLIQASILAPRSIPFLIQTFGVLTDLLHSQRAVKMSSNLPAVALRHLLSSLYDQLKKRKVSSILIFLEKMLMLRYGDNNSEIEDLGEGWVLCLSFMMASEVLFEGTFDNENDGRGVAFRIIEIVRCKGKIVDEADHSSCGKRRRIDVSVVEKCFPKQLAAIDRLASVRNQFEENKSENAFSFITNFDFDDELKGFSSINENIDLNEANRKSDDKNDTQENESIGQTTLQDTTTPVTCIQSAKPENYTKLNIESFEVATSTAQKTSASNTNNSPIADTEVLSSQMKDRLLELRSLILQLRQNSHRNTSTELRDVADRVVQLLERGGTEIGGARGVELVGNTLAYGLSSEDSSLSFTDSLISLVCPSFIQEGTSALRTSAFIRSCIFPLCQELDDGRKKPASRILVSTVSSLAKDRPKECVESLFLPIFSSQKAGPIQCELLSRIIKDSSSVSSEVVSQLVSGITSLQNHSPFWTEHTLSVITACLQRQPSLDDDAINTLSLAIERLVLETMNKSTAMKLSAFFHTFVLKYGNQIRLLDCVPRLEQAACKLKTFLAKAISTALKKLK